jgi:RNA polymerase sigma factor (sigma-70 family)
VALPPFQAFLDEHRTEVYRVLVAAVGPSDADDCFQETFISALGAYDRLREGANLRAWVLTIAHRKAIDHHRARTRRPVPMAEAPEPPPEPAGESRPGLDGRVWALVRELPPKQRAAVVHRYVTDLSYADIGAVIGSSEEAARRSAHEGLRRLRREWER